MNNTHSAAERDNTPDADRAGLEAALIAEYGAALKDYLEGCGEASLERAYDLGRKAIGRYAIVDIASIHREVMIGTLIENLNSKERVEVSKKAFEFLIECLSPFEMTLRGYVDANKALHAEITERELIEAKLAASLAEKEVLLKEIHHRVKNNIQVISSLLSLQAQQASDPVVKELFRETQNKVRGIALIHEKLYRSKDLSQINYADYLKDMATTMFNSYNVAASQISLDIDASSVTIDIERAVPVSLIVSEMLTNSLKHAFPDRRKGRIAIGLRADGKDVILTFSDNGVGLPASVTFEKTDTLGIGLLAGLTKQLNGTIAVDRTGGTSYTVTFPGKSSEEGE